MLKNHSKVLVTLLIISLLSAYPIYRVYHAWQLNLRLERFMAHQIISLQNKNQGEQFFRERNLPIPNRYFVVRSEAYYIYGNLFMHDREGTFNSYWISQQGNEQRVSKEQWKEEFAKVADQTMSWTYQIRPVSGSVVCVMTTALPPNNWTGPMHSVTGVSTWSIDTSKASWQLTPYYDGPCEFRDTEILRTLLLFVP